MKEKMKFQSDHKPLVRTAMENCINQFDNNYSSFNKMPQFKKYYQEQYQLLKKIDCDRQLEKLKEKLNKEKNELIERIQVYTSNLFSEIEKMKEQFQFLLVTTQKIIGNKQISINDANKLKEHNFMYLEQQFWIQYGSLNKHIKFLERLSLPPYPTLTLIDKYIQEYRLKEFYKQHFLNYCLVPEPYKFIRGRNDNMIDNKDTIYIGEVSLQKPHGRGLLIDKKKQKIIQGVFIDGELVWGNSTSINEFGNQTIYQGTFQQGIKDGIGKLFFSDWEKYSGQFQNGEYQGQGKYKEKTGNMYKFNLIIGFKVYFLKVIRLKEQKLIIMEISIFIIIKYKIYGEFYVWIIIRLRCILFFERLFNWIIQQWNESWQA